ncbi:MAG: hypothetical protein Q8P12_00225, partial [bacterium]|nr:hypothetical protein [bacterium]
RANNVENEFKRSKELADRAANAAQQALEAAMKCDKAAFARFSKLASDLADQTRASKGKADGMANDLDKQVKDTVDKVNSHVANMQKTLGQGFQSAKEAGLKDNSVAVGNLRDAQQALDREVARQNSEGTKENNFKDEGSMNKLNRANNEFNNQMKKIREGSDPGDTLRRAELLLKDGAAWLENRCPPKVSAVPRAPTEVFALVDNRPQVNVCIPAGRNPQEAASVLGLSKHQVLATTPTGTIVRAPGNSKTVEKIAKEKGIDLCFVESDYCMIMTPLTPFRGHDHKAHVQSGREPHDHDGPDPPWNWGVKPPETVIRWKANR